MGLPARKIDRYTYADYATWPEDVRYELIHGEAVAMSPSPSLTHQRLAGRVFTLLVDALKDSPCEAVIAPFDVLLDAPRLGWDQAEVVVQPDALVVCDPDRNTPRGVRGAPDLVVEVLSPGSVIHDTVVKFRLYAEHGVPEYWIINPDTRRLHQFVLEDGRYVERGSLGRGETLACVAVPAVVLEGDSLFAGLD